MRALVLALTVSVASPAMAQQALVGATLIGGDGRVVEDSVVVVESPMIACAGSRDECVVPDGAEVVDLSGRYITPGLIDGHVHFGQTGWIDGRADGLSVPILYPQYRIQRELQRDPDRWHAAYLCSGITAVFDVGGPMWTLTGTQGYYPERWSRVQVRAAGPLITHAPVQDPGDRFNPFLSMTDESQVRSDIAKLAQGGANAIKVWYLDPPADRVEELDALLAVAGEASREVGLPLIVHATELRNAKAALRAGASMLVHSVWDRVVDDEFLELLTSSGAYYAPTMVVDRNWGRAIETIATGKAAIIDDPNNCVDEALLGRIGEVDKILAEVGAEKLPDPTQLAQRAFAAGKRLAVMEANLLAVRDAGGKIVLSTDAGNPLTVHGPSILWEMEEMQAAGMAPLEILRSGTVEAAAAMGMSDSIGSLEAGKVADLLVLAEDPRVSVSAFRTLTHVMRGGKLRTQEELQVR